MVMTRVLRMVIGRQNATLSRVCVVTLATLVYGGCGEDDGARARRGDAGGGAGTAGVCEPGRSVECTGPAGCRGGQVCRDDGSGWGACDCSGEGVPREGGTADAREEPPRRETDLDPRLVLPAEGGADCTLTAACDDQDTCRPVTSTEWICEKICADGQEACGGACTRSNQCGWFQTCFAGECRRFCGVFGSCNDDDKCLDFGAFRSRVGICVAPDVPGSPIGE
jgi:hypothetical protein